MKQLSEMSWEELTKLREKLNSEPGDNDEDDDVDEHGSGSASVRGLLALIPTVI